MSRSASLPNNASIPRTSAPPANPALPQSHNADSFRTHPGPDEPLTSHVAGQSRLEKLPAEIVDQILSYLTHPRSRLPGLTEYQSEFDFPGPARIAVKKDEDLTQPPDHDRWGVDLFSLIDLRHPFNELALASKKCNKFVENYCSHLVRLGNSTLFNLPFAHLDRHDAKRVYPDMSGIVYRRLFLQTTIRRCIYCFKVLDRYPFYKVNRLLTTCSDCFYCQMLVRTVFLFFVLVIDFCADP